MRCDISLPPSLPNKTRPPLPAPRSGRSRLSTVRRSGCQQRRICSTGTYFSFSCNWVTPKHPLGLEHNLNRLGMAPWGSQEPVPSMKRVQVLPGRMTPPRHEALSSEHSRSWMGSRCERCPPAPSFLLSTGAKPFMEDLPRPPPHAPGVGRKSHIAQAGD